MGAAFTTDPQRIFHISPPGTTNASEILELVTFANELAVDVETGWEELPIELQEVLTKLAYRELNPGFRRRAVARLRYTVLVLRGEEEVLNKLWNATNRLRESVLDAIERSNPEYQEDLTQAIKGALGDTDVRTMNAEQSHERNRQIFDRAFD